MDAHGCTRSPSRAVAAVDELRADVWQQFGRQDERMGRLGAMNAAMVQMATSAANIQTRNRVAVGVGYSEGESALAVGYQRSISRNVSFTLGGAFSSSETSAGAGLGFGW